jgi:V/A-type H+-transporting ATPase subunit C
MDATFFGSASKCRLLRNELLNAEKFNDLIGAESFSDVLRIMNSTGYASAIQSLSGLYKSYELLELSSDKRMMEMILKISESPPANGMEAIKSYISRWDIDTIKNILTSKYLGKELKRENLFVINQAHYPVGMVGNLLSSEDYSLMINENDVEGITKYLVKLGYGIYLMRYMDEYRKERDISVLLYSLDIAYYSKLAGSVKFFLGNEEPMRTFIKEEIDVKNLNTLIKSKELSLDFDSIQSGLINMGGISIQKLSELYNSSEDNEIKDKCLAIFRVSNYEKNEEMTSGEAETILKRELLSRVMPRFSLQSNSIGAIFETILRFENERNNLRIIFAGKAYGLSLEKIKKLMVQI